jgi:hypothetical protein
MRYASMRFVSVRRVRFDGYLTFFSKIIVSTAGRRLRFLRLASSGASIQSSTVTVAHNVDKIGWNLVGSVPAVAQAPRSLSIWERTLSASRPSSRTSSWASFPWPVEVPHLISSPTDVGPTDSMPPRPS